MTTSAKKADLSRFCSVCAKQVGLDAAGTAHSYQHVLAVEIPLPWPESMYSEPGVFPQELLDLRKLIVESYQRGEPLHISAFAIAPDPAYGVPGYRRVISYRRPEGTFAAYTQEEYLVPEAEAGPLCWALLVDDTRLPEFAGYRQPASGIRDLMVCTHGAVDAACAKFGFPIYRQLRRLADESEGTLRVWRISHFGGHVFAPTLLDFPEFRYWGYVESEQASLLAHRQGEAAQLRQQYRGWAGFENTFIQIAERELFVRHGWPWMTYLKQGSVLAQDDAPETEGQPTWAEVRISYTSADGAEQGNYQARVELRGHLECIYSSSETETYAYPQYVVTRLEQIV